MPFLLFPILYLSLWPVGAFFDLPSASSFVTPLIISIYRHLSPFTSQLPLPASPPVNIHSALQIDLSETR